MKKRGRPKMNKTSRKSHIITVRLEHELYKNLNKCTQTNNRARFIRKAIDTAIKNIINKKPDETQ